MLRDGPDMQHDLQRAIAASLKDQGKANLGGGEREGGVGGGKGGGTSSRKSAAKGKNLSLKSSSEGDIEKEEQLSAKASQRGFLLQAYNRFRV